MTMFLYEYVYRHNSDLFRSKRTLVEWQVRLPIPSPPEGIHERFTRCLGNIASTSVAKKEGEEADGIVMSDPNGVTHLDDTKVFLLITVWYLIMIYWINIFSAHVDISLGFKTPQTSRIGRGQ